MRGLANFLWHIPFLGFLNALAVFCVGLILCLTLVAAPIGVGLMEYAKFLLFPFSLHMVDKSEMNIHDGVLWRSFSFIVSLLYLPIGLILCLIAVVQIVCLSLTVVGLPAALILFKSLGTFFNPVNKICVSVDEG